MLATQANFQVSGVSSDPLIALHRSKRRTLRAQLERELRRAIQDKRLLPGSALPPSRTLATELGVARSVVVEAYGNLTAEGYLEARQGARTRVCAASDRTSRPRPKQLQCVPSGLRFVSGLPDPALFPRVAWRRHYSAVLRSCPDSALGHCDAQGAIELRTALAEHLGRVRALSTTPEQIVICSGFAQGLALICRTLAQRGTTRVAVEDPCFTYHRHQITTAGLQAVPVEVDTEGLIVSRLEQLDIGAVLLSPAHSYPSGSALAASRRRALLEWAHRSDALVIEDDYDAEFRYDRAPVSALQGMAPQ
jgi:GntR family transcriptional regulator/MocR family aminotransferase